MPSGRRHVTGPFTEIHGETSMILKAYFDGPLLIAYPYWASSSSFCFCLPFQPSHSIWGEKKKEASIFITVLPNILHIHLARGGRNMSQRGSEATFLSGTVGSGRERSPGKRGLLGQRTSKQQIEHIQIYILWCHTPLMKVTLKFILVQFWKRLTDWKSLINSDFNTNYNG